VFGEEIGKLFGQPFDLLLGRRTYDIFAAYWPYHEGGPYDDIDRPSWLLLAPRVPFLELAGTISGTAH
jgi:dihydrofolate reductase